jgi:glycosyltransferase involved in cell wall biosynthesis
MTKTAVAVIPAFNEEKTIKTVIESTAHFVDSIIVIDDGSTDGTYKQAKTTTASVTRYTTNRGYGVALRHGISLALKMGAEWIIAIDGDGEHTPSDIAPLLEKAKSLNADIVVGSRFVLSGHAYNMSLMRRISNKITNLMLHLLFRVKITDSQSGFRIYNRRIFYAISPEENNYLIGTEIIIESAMKGLNIIEAPITSVSKGLKLGNHNSKEVIFFLLLLIRQLPKPKKRFIRI